jgi:hypothetical protein
MTFSGGRLKRRASWGGCVDERVHFVLDFLDLGEEKDGTRHRGILMKLRA